MSIVPYIDRAAPIPLEAAIALLGNEKEGMAFDFTALQGYIRDRATPANFFLGDPNDKLAYTSPSPKYITNGHGTLVSGTTLRCDHDPATLDTSSTTLHALHSQKTLTTTGAVTYTAGQTVRLTDAGDINNWILGTVNSYSGGTLVVDVRASSGYFVASSWKVIVSLGLLIEEQRTNLLTWSEAFDNAAWFKTQVTVSANTNTAPDGENTADTVQAAVSTNVHVIIQSYSFTSGTTYTYSQFVKYDNHRYISLRIYDSSEFPHVGFDLQNGVVTFEQAGVTGAIEDYGNGWYRVSITKTAVATGAGNAGMFLQPDDTNTQGTWTPTGNEKVSAWGAQLEAGSFPTSYIKTEGSQVTRNADDITLATTEFPFDAAEGALIIVARNGLGGGGLAIFNDGTSSNQISAGANPVSEFSGFYVKSGGAVQADLFAGSTATADTVIRYGSAWAANDFVYYTDGTQRGTDGSGSIPSVDTLRLGFDRGNNYRNGHIKSLVYLPRRMSNADLQARTA